MIQFDRNSERHWAIIILFFLLLLMNQSVVLALEPDPPQQNETTEEEVQPEEPANEVPEEPVNETDETTVTESVYEDEIEVTGRLIAEGFGDEVDYSQIWYQEEHVAYKTTVEAVSGDQAFSGVIYPDGSFSIKLPQGEQRLRIAIPGYLSQERVLEITEPTVLEPIYLDAGDINGDGTINMIDLYHLAKLFGHDFPYRDAESCISDLNKDGHVDIGDLSLILNHLLFKS